MNSIHWKPAVVTMITISAIAVSFPSRAGSIVVPNANTDTPGPGAGSKAVFDSNARWQQIYINQEFQLIPGDIIRINELRFRIDEMTATSSFSTVAQGLSIFMSTTTRTYDTASPLFAQNEGSELFEALPLSNLPMSGSRTSATSFDVVVPLPNKYEYDRRAGNLLIDIRSVGGASIPFLDIVGGAPGATFGIGGSLDLPAGTINRAGYVTELRFDIIPEPRTACLISIGLIVLLSTKKVC
jgi:hypothetical protein